MVSINQFIVNALSEKISALQTLDILEKSAKRAYREAFTEALSRVPDVDAPKNDTL